VGSVEGLIPSWLRHLRTSNQLLSWPPKAEEPTEDAETAPKAKAKVKAKQEK
jgi:hypothetical protein